MSERPVLAVEDLTMHYSTRAGTVRAVDGVSFSVARGQALGLVGESGCGKSSIALTLLKLLPENAQIISGKVLLDGTDIVPLSEEQLRAYRWDRISMVFQAAMNSLNPVYRVGEQIIEALEIHVKSAREESIERVRRLYDLVSLDPSFILRYPHEYSGGMKQRAIIAMALACEPDLIIADEPTTALDVIVQDRILREMRNIQAALDMSMIYISHDMAVIAEVSDVVGIMYAGKIVELGETAEVFKKSHPSVYAGADVGVSERDGRAARADDADGRAAEPAGPAPGLPLPPALSVCDGRVPVGRAADRSPRGALGDLLEPAGSVGR